MTPDDSTLSPRPKAGDDPERNADFDTKMQAFMAEEDRDLGDSEMNIQTYLERLYKRAEREREVLQEYRDNPEMMKQLSDDQQREMNARLKVLDYNEQTRELQQQYMNDPDDPAIAAKYEERQKELKDYRELMQNSEEFKDNPHMVRMRELEKDLENAEGMEAQNAVKLQLAEEMRGFKRDIAAQGDEGVDKIISFVERNKDNKVIKESGMMDTIELIKERRTEKTEPAKERGAEGAAAGGEDELEKGEVIPSGRAKTGAVDAEGEETAKTAQAEIAGSADDGKAGDTRVRLEGKDIDRETALASTASTTPAAPTEDRGASLA